MVKYRKLSHLQKIDLSLYSAICDFSFLFLRIAQARIFPFFTSHFEFKSDNWYKSNRLSTIYGNWIWDLTQTATNCQTGECMTCTIDTHYPLEPMMYCSRRYRYCTFWTMNNNYSLDDAIVAYFICSSFSLSSISMLSELEIAKIFATSSYMKAVG